MEFSIGTEVLVENTADKQRKGGKLNQAWLGPYTISDAIGKGVYELKNKKEDVIRNKVNINRLKLYIRRSDGTERICDNPKRVTQLKKIKGKGNGMVI